LVFPYIIPCLKAI